MTNDDGLRGTFSIAYGVIADISTPAERGSYVSALSLGYKPNVFYSIVCPNDLE